MDTFTVVLFDSVDFSPDPVPSNESEQLLFPQYFETLVRLDCTGQLRPGLAEAWSADESGRVWTFVLPDGRFADGSPEAAPRVVSSWRAREAAVRGLGIESVAVRDGTRLVVTLNQLADSAPRLFANPGLAVSLHPSNPAPGSDLLISRSDGPPPTRIHFRIEENSDPRDVLDRDADLMVTRDPALVDYAANRPELAIFPLPWSRTFVLLQPPGAEKVRMMAAPDSLRPSLARDAVRTDARPASPPFWWEGLTACHQVAKDDRAQVSSRIVYDRNDQVARELAERIVGLERSGSPLQAAGLEWPDLAAALRNGTERAYILALPRRTTAPCHDSASWPSGAAARALIDTRAHAIVRQGSPPLAVDWNGSIRVDVEAWMRPEQP